MKRNKSLFIIRIKVYNQEGFEDTNGVIRRYQRGNQKPQIEEIQTKQWSKKRDKRTNSNLQNTTRKT